MPIDESEAGYATALGVGLIASILGNKKRQGVLEQVEEDRKYERAEGLLQFHLDNAQTFQMTPYEYFTQLPDEALKEVQKAQKTTGKYVAEILEPMAAQQVAQAQARGMGGVQTFAEPEPGYEVVSAPSPGQAQLPPLAAVWGPERMQALGETYDYVGPQGVYSIAMSHNAGSESEAIDDIAALNGQLAKDDRDRQGKKTPASERAEDLIKSAVSYASKEVRGAAGGLEDLFNMGLNEQQAADYANAYQRYVGSIFNSGILSSEYDPGELAQIKSMMLDATPSADTFGMSMFNLYADAFGLARQKIGKELKQWTAADKRRALEIMQDRYDSLDDYTTFDSFVLDLQELKKQVGKAR